MSTHERRTPPWLPDLMDQVEDGLQRMTAGKHDQRPALERELEQLRESAQGWSTSQGNSKLPQALRAVIEKDWLAAIERQTELEAELGELDQDALRAEHLVRPEQVVERLDR